jgi:2-dehydropantoate 2-reductase
MNNYEFAILGAGALGSILGAHLSRSGHRVLMLARGQRAVDIDRYGLRIKGLADFTQRAPVLANPQEFQGADTFIIATKAHATQSVLSAYQHAKVGVALSVQNGLMKNEHMIAVWGREHVLGAVADTSGQLQVGGEILFTRNEHLCIGELGGGMSARAQQVANVMDASGIRTRAVPNIESLEWSKFAAWAGMMTLSIATRAVTWKYLTDPGLALVLARIVHELGRLAAASMIELSDQSPLPVATIMRVSEDEAVAIILAFGRELRTSAPEHRMSSLQDLGAGRALEIEETLGYAVRQAGRLNISLPILESFYSLVAGIDRIAGRQPMS